MYRIVKEPEGLIISLKEVKDYLKVENDLEDRIISMLIKAAEDAADKYMLRYIRKTVFEYFEESSSSIIELRRARFNSVDKVELLSNGEWFETSDYSISSNSDIYSVIKIGPAHSACRITFTVGYDELPPSLKTAILIIIANMYENRGDDSEYSTIPKIAEQILNGYRVIRAH